MHVEERIHRRLRWQVCGLLPEPAHGASARGQRTEPANRASEPSQRTGLANRAWLTTPVPRALLGSSNVTHLRNDTGNARACQTWLVKWLALVIYKREAVGLECAVRHRWFAPLMPARRGVAFGACVQGGSPEGIRLGGAWMVDRGPERITRVASVAVARWRLEETAGVVCSGPSRRFERPFDRV